MIQEAIARVVERTDLTADESRAVMSEMISGTATPSQVASFITAMRMKGETEDELMGFAQAMREKALRINSPVGAIDLCGTGGDGMNTFNVSTAASFVVAAAGTPVAKHGNRSVSSRCGSADVLGALGIPVDLDPEQVSKCLDSTGLCFMFAPVFHASMKNVLVPRRELGLRTFFNMLGPMTNPAGVKNQLIGVYDFSIAGKMAKVLGRLGSSRVMIVNGSGTDEITNTGVTRVVESFDGRTKEYELSPEMFRMDRAQRNDIKGGAAADNARTLLSVMKGEQSPRSDIVVLNAGAALYVAGKAASIGDGLALAREAIQSGRAFAKLKEFADAARALETERQRHQSVSELMRRPIMPDVLAERAKDVSRDLMRQIEEAGLTAQSEVLDNDLIERPTVLSAIVLRRILSAASQPAPAGVVVDPRRRPLSKALESSEGIAVIAEYKPHSPSAPSLYVPPEPERAIRAYAGSGVAAVSVLAEPDFFSGSTELFSFFRRNLDLPLLFKDFVVSEKQIETASSVGADSILLIAKALNADALDRFVDTCMANNIEPLVELHDMDDLAKLASCSNARRVKIVGVNSRDLRTMSTDLSRLRALRAYLPPSKITIAESGFRGPDDIEFVHGFDGLLVGSALMTAHDLEAELSRIVTACRRAAR